MKTSVVIFIVMSIFFASGSYARIVVREENGACASCISTTYFVQAADISPQLNLSEKIATPSGVMVERIDDPHRGLLLKDPSGLLWTSSLMVDRPIADPPRFSTEDVYPGHAKWYCARIGGRPPTLAEYKSLAALFFDKSHKYDSESAARILEPGYPIEGCSRENGTNACLGGWYLTNITLTHKNYGVFSDIFSLYGTGFQVVGNSGNLAYVGKTNEYASLKCVVSQDMPAPKAGAVKIK